jgi:glycine/D-amino acid oxidase-like deaminating enzyme
VVVGAGFTGLSAALTLAEAGARVWVLEAGEPGGGASTRNAGMIGSPHKLGGEATVARYGADLAGRLFAEGREAYDWTAALAERVGAGFRRWGRLRLAWTRGHFEALRAEARVLRERGGYAVEALGPRDLRAEIGSDRYFGGLLHPDHGGLDPQRFHDGLLRAALEAGAQVACGVAVEAVRDAPGGVRVRAARRSPPTRR